ncbi:MAG TPA: hypothetical protein VN728_02350 [Stellaceae bacterium]|jgi:hypothetical protein|nr:hypothetical protein [Stellaceae bacterium]
MAVSAKGVRRVGFHDCYGGGQVYVDNGFAYIGHIHSPSGTSIIDVRDPKNPKEVAYYEMPRGTHSHKARAVNGLLVTNHEVDPNPADGPAAAPSDFKGGLGIYDVSNPLKPRKILDWVTHGHGVHRYDFDGRYVYCSPTVEGYRGNIVMILDLKNPEKPEEVGRWWEPGQWIAGGETPTWKGADHRCHHPLRSGNRLYTSYWQGGFHILNIDDMSKPKRVSGLDWSPPFACPTHSCVRIPFDIFGRQFAIVADEDVQRPETALPAFMWMIDITDEEHPVPVGTYQVEGLDHGNHANNSGCHQPVEKIRGTEVPFAWFAQGLRIIDISHPHTPKEVAHYVPEPAAGAKRCQSNDVYQDDRGLIFLIDRIRGLEILERV